MLRSSLAAKKQELLTYQWLCTVHQDIAELHVEADQRYCKAKDAVTVHLKIKKLMLCGLIFTVDQCVADYARRYLVLKYIACLKSFRFGFKGVVHCVRTAEQISYQIPRKHHTDYR